MRDERTLLWFKKKTAKAASSDACLLCGVVGDFGDRTNSHLKGLELKKIRLAELLKYILVYMLNWIHKLENLPVNARA